MASAAQVIIIAAFVTIGACTLASHFHERRLLGAVYGRPRRYTCGPCGYRLEGIPGDVCPECGAPRGLIDCLDPEGRARPSLWLIPMVVVSIAAMVLNVPDGFVHVTFLAVALVLPVALFAVRVPVWMPIALLAIALAVLLKGSRDDMWNDPDGSPWAVLGLAMGLIVVGDAGLIGVHRMRGGSPHPDRPLREPSSRA